MTRPRRSSRWTTSIAVLAVLAGLSLGCAPPTTPTGVNVQWSRDAGGTTDPSTGSYDAAWNRYVTRGGVTTGPTPVSSEPLLGTPPPLLLGPNSFTAWADGTARFPWNGYAGEGITVSASGIPYPDYTATFPAGTCTVLNGGPGTSLRGALPSPDGELIALVHTNNDVPMSLFSTIEIRSLNPGSCPVVTTVRYERVFDGSAWTGHSVSGAAVTWAPNSRAILYALDQQADLSASIVRLDAMAGDAPDFVLSPAEGCSVPLGWSVGNRILLQCVRQTASGPSSRIQSIPLGGGGPTHVIDTFTPGPGTITGTTVYHYGYYAPGTTTIVFNKAVPVENSDGAVQAWFQVHTVYDTPLAQSTPLQGSAPPFGWHQVAVPQVGIPEPPFEFTDVPNPEIIERFVR